MVVSPVAMDGTGSGPQGLRRCWPMVAPATACGCQQQPRLIRTVSDSHWFSTLDC
ncbi:MAG: hypothetical protein VKJ09_08425 [Leptolyngbya sp.]|nr:hypothetical protein [Leptolyngbya sp.]